MKLKEPKNKNYCATVVEIKQLVNLENCNNLQAAIIMGNQVIVDKSVNIGDVGLYFPLETQLLKDYLSNNNLYRDKTLNKDIEKGGYFEENGRIRCVKLRGNKSEGLFMPISSLKFIGDNLELNIGDEFDEINNIEICKKYVIKFQKTPGLGGNKNQKGKKPRESKIIDNQFRFHQDTSMLYKNMHRINPNDLISITYKCHGCVSSDTIIETLEFGNLTIDNIINNKIKCHIKSYDIENNEIVYSLIDDYYYKKNDGEWFEIELENNKKIKITSNNPVWLPELNCYREVKDLKIGDILLYN